MTFVTRTISALRAIFLPLGMSKVALCLVVGLMLFLTSLAQAAGPVITSQPQSITLAQNSALSLSVSATGNGTMTYQWQKDGVIIPGATSSTFNIANLKTWHIGDYKVVISDANGLTASDIATLHLIGYDNEIYKGLVAYYPFDGNALDSSVFGYHGVELNTSFVGDRYNSNTKSCFFGGSNSKVSIPSLLDLSGGSFSISFWSLRNSPEASSAKMIFDQGTLDQSHRRISLIFRPSTDNFWPKSSLGFSFWASELHSPANTSILSSWENWHVVYNKTAATRTIYKNGVQMATMASGVSTTSTGATIGNSNTENLSFGGCMDDFRIYNRSLSSTEVSKLYAVDSGISRYAIVSGNYTWSEAKADAEARGGRLAVLDNQDKIDLAQKFLLSQGQWTDLWIGLTDQTNEGQWKWITATDLNLNRWSPGEPNNIDGADHAYIWASAVFQDPKWDDGAVTSRKSYLIELAPAQKSYLFALPESSGLGAITGFGEFPYGSTTTLTSSPNPGYRFTGWTGDASGTQNPLTITMDADKTVGATFDKDLSDADNDGLTAFD